MSMSHKSDSNTITSGLQELREQVAEANQRATFLESLRCSSLMMTSSLDLQVVLHAVLDNMLSLLPGFQNADIFLYQDGTLKFGAARSFDSPQSAPYVQPGEDGLTYSVARS